MDNIASVILPLTPVRELTINQCYNVIAWCYGKASVTLSSLVDLAGQTDGQICGAMLSRTSTAIPRIQFRDGKYVVKLRLQNRHHYIIWAHAEMDGDTLFEMYCRLMVLYITKAHEISIVEQVDKTYADSIAIDETGETIFVGRLHSLDQSLDFSR